MRYLITCGLCAAIATLSLTASAQDAPTAAPQAAQQDRSNPRVSIGLADDKTSGRAIRASQLTGMNIVNPKGESLGRVDDIVLDGQTGRIRYLAVSYGGFLGFGDTLFAVPYEAFRFYVDPADAGNQMFVLDVTQQQLEGAQGFDQDNWPNFADKKFTDELDRRYRVQRRDDDGR